MADPITFESIGVSMSTQSEDPRAKPQTDTPFKILIMGDFSGRTNRGEETDGSDIDCRKTYRVDRDSDETIMENMGVSVCLPAAGGGTPWVELAFTEMDDFHPEKIYYNTSIFKVMRKTRNQLLDSDTAAETADFLSGSKDAGAEKEGSDKGQASPTQEKNFAKETTAGLLDQVLNASAAATVDTSRSRPQTDWDRFLSDIVRPHLVPDIGDAQDAMVAAIDHSISATMRRILHHPDLQALEAAWRALRFCLRNLETDEQLTVNLLDVTQCEIAADLTAHEEIKDTALYRKLSSAGMQHSQEAPWTLLAGLYSFSASKKDAITLARLGGLAQALGAPFVGAGDAGLVNCASLAANPDPADWKMKVAQDDENAWQVIRTLPEAGWVGLALPRFVIRMPYGEKTDPVDAFDFEEMSNQAKHEAYLWANPVFAIVQILGRTFTRQGWNWSRGLENEIDGLPILVVDENGQKEIKSCAEAFLGERALETLVGNGLMPLVAFKDSDRVKLARFQSIADPPSPLHGSWRW
jgi:type VI secretion system protein ImpC